MGSTNEPTNTNENEKKFEPTLNMINVLEEAMNMEGSITITKICQKGGVDRSTWYDWNKNPDFKAWWKKSYEDHMLNSVWLLDKICYIRSAVDYRYMELLQMKFAKFRRTNDVTSDFKKVRVIMGDKDADPNTD